MLLERNQHCECQHPEDWLNRFDYNAGKELEKGGKAINKISGKIYNPKHTLKQCQTRCTWTWAGEPGLQPGLG